MARVLELAKKGIGKTSPNPMVGAVLVKNGKIISDAYHQKAGFAHAEIKALQPIASQQIKKATLYVNLEPCCHYGKTPPCCEFLVKSGLKRVVVAMKDPNPLVNGRGIAFLRKAGIRVDTGLLKSEAEKLNEAFIRFITSEYPFVILKIAATMDGKIASISGDSRWITNEKSRKEVHKLRSRVDAIITSSKTVMIDDPHLGVRRLFGKDPLRIIIDSHLITRPTSKVYRDINVLVVTGKLATPQKIKNFKKAGIEIYQFKSDHISLKSLLYKLHSRHISSVMVEAGTGLASAFLKQKLVDKLYYFIAPKILGDGLPSVNDLNIKTIRAALKLKNIEIKNFGDDIMFSGYF